MFQKKLSLGKIDYAGKGIKNHRVEIDVKIRSVHRIGRRTWDLEYAPDDLLELSICGGVWLPHGKDIANGGQCGDTIKEFFKDRPSVMRLCEIWDSYHLNDMKSGTRLQHEALDARPKQKNPLDWYGDACAYLASKNLNPDRGYTFGSAWLYQPLPAEIVEEIKTLCEAIEKEFN